MIGDISQSAGTITVGGASGVKGKVTQNADSNFTTLDAVAITKGVEQSGKGKITVAGIDGDVSQSGGTIAARLSVPADPTSAKVLTLKGNLSQDAGAVVTADSLVLAPSAGKGDVSLASDKNAIKAVSGSAKSVKLTTSTALAVDGLDTSATDGAITLTAGAGEKITFQTANTTAGTGTITLNSAADQGAVTITASTIDNSKEGALLTQNGTGASIVSETGEALLIKGAVKQVEGTIAAASGKTLTIAGNLEQAHASDATKAVIGDGNGAVVLGGNVVQTLGKVDATTLTINGAGATVQQDEGAIV